MAEAFCLDLLSKTKKKKAMPMRGLNIRWQKVYLAIPSGILTREW